jgi:acyl-CoA synthetase (NDP forming)
VTQARSEDGAVASAAGDDGLATTASDRPGAPRDLSALFDPDSIAVIGASEDPRKWGNWLARRALRGEHRRAVHLVNRAGGEVLGRRAHRSLRELEEPVALVVIAVPAVGLDQAVDDALAAGARAIVAISAGTSAEADRELAGRVRAAGAVLVGPNCLGVFDSGSALELASNDLPAGSIGLVSQSGNLALEIGLLAAGAGLGFSRFVSLGNQADLEAHELIDALAEHDRTRAIALYIEDFRDGRAFARAAARAHEAGKPVVLLTVAAGAATARAVRSHTGALASDSSAIDAACRAAGIERVATPSELVDLLQGLLRAVPPAGRRLAVLADGGGHGGVAAAVAADSGLVLPELGEQTVAKLRAQLPPTAACSNPIDLAGGGEQDIRTFERAARVLLRSGEVDAILMTGYFGGYSEYTDAFGDAEVAVGEALARTAARERKPLVAHTMYHGTPAADALRRGGVAVYPGVEQAIGVLSRLARRAERTPTGIPELPEAARPLGEPDYGSVRQMLACGGVPFVAQRTVDSAQAARAAAAEIGYPVVLKALGRLHKSDDGGVALDLADDAALVAALDDMQRRLAPRAFSVEAMAATGEGVELLIGARWDERFGPVALVGMGGVYAEVLADVAVALAPLDNAAAERLLRCLRCWPMLAGARGRKPLDHRAAASALVALSRVAAEHPEIGELEVNPLLVGPHGVLALDARALVRDSPGARRAAANTNRKGAVDGLHLQR